MKRTKVKNLAKQIRGVSYKPEDLHDSLDEDSVILLRANNIDEGKINFDDVVYVDKSKVSDEQYLKVGDVLICASSGSKQLVGKAASVVFDSPCTFGAFCKVVRPNNNVADYLGKYFQSGVYRRKISEVAIGANINNIRNEHIDSLELPIYEPAQAQKIVEKIGLLQNIIDNRKCELSKLDELIKARFVEMFGDPEYNTLDWPVKKLNALCNVGSSKRIYQEEQTMDGIPFWRISDLIAKMDTGNVESSLYIPEIKYEELKKQGLVPEPGDILVTSRGTLGRCYIISPNDRFYFQDGMISWLSRYADEITPVYIQYLFDMPGFRKQIDSMQAGSTVAYLSIAMLKKLNIMLPDRERQEQFACFVAQVDKSKVAIQAALDKAQLLFDSLMHEYFE